MGRIDILTGTLGKALGGASGGYTSGRKRDRRAAAPAFAAVSVLQHASRRRSSPRRSRRSSCSTSSTELRDKLEENTKFFRAAMTERGLTITPARIRSSRSCWATRRCRRKFAARMLAKGVYVIGFFYPVVPQGTARIRTQVSAAHSREDLEHAVNAFAETNKELVG